MFHCHTGWQHLYPLLASQPTTANSVTSESAVTFCSDIYFDSSITMSHDFAWHRKCAHSSGHCCSEELDNTANPITSNWSWKDCKLAALCFVWPFFNWHFFVYIHTNYASWFMLLNWLRHAACRSHPDTFITMGQLEIEFEYWNKVANVAVADIKVYTNPRCWKQNVSLK